MGMGQTLKLTYHALLSLINDWRTLTLTQMQYLGECLTPWYIDAAIGALEADGPPQGKLFTFLHYDFQLELPWIERELGNQEIVSSIGRVLTSTDVVRLREAEDPTTIPDLYKLASAAAAKQVKPEHWAAHKFNNTSAQSYEKQSS